MRNRNPTPSRSGRTEGRIRSAGYLAAALIASLDVLVVVVATTARSAVAPSRFRRPTVTTVVTVPPPDPGVFPEHTN